MGGGEMVGGQITMVGAHQCQCIGGQARQTQKREAVTKGKSPQAWPNIRDDPRGKAYAKSDWAAKTNEGSVARRIPLLSGRSGYSEWGE